jgi:thymidylate synthase (FAD)
VGSSPTEGTERVTMEKIKVLDKGYVRLVDVLGGDLSVVNAARVSYDKESDVMESKDIKLIDFLLRENHTSPFRHAALTFEVYAPLLVARQWWKYAVASTHIDDQNGWNESSRRYVTESEEFYLPKAKQWRSKPTNSKQGSGDPIPASEGKYYTEALNRIIKDGVSQYQEAMEAGVAPELARLFLPAYAMYVRWRWTVSLQGVITFLDQRLGHDAQWEIQEYASAVSTLTNQKFPVSMHAWKHGGK